MFCLYCGKTSFDKTQTFAEPIPLHYRDVKQMINRPTKIAKAKILSTYNQIRHTTFTHFGAV